MTTDRTTDLERLRTRRVSLHVPAVSTFGRGADWTDAAPRGHEHDAGHGAAGDGDERDHDHDQDQDHDDGRGAAWDGAEADRDAGPPAGDDGRPGDVAPYTDGVGAPDQPRSPEEWSTHEWSSQEWSDEEWSALGGQPDDRSWPDDSLPPHRPDDESDQGPAAESVPGEVAQHAVDDQGHQEDTVVLRPPPAWRRLVAPASVPVVTALQLVLATGVGVVLAPGLTPVVRTALVVGLLVMVVLATWPVGDRRGIVVVLDLFSHLLRRALARRSVRKGELEPALLPPLVVGRADGPNGPEMGVVHDGSGWAAIAIVGRRGTNETAEDPASWLPETIDAIVRSEASVDRQDGAPTDRRVGSAQVLLERDSHGLETLVVVRVDPDSSPVGGVLGAVDGVAPLLRHRLRRVDESLEACGLAARTLDPAEVVGQLTRAYALDDDLGNPRDEDASAGRVDRLGEHRTCVVSTRGVEQVTTVRFGSSTPETVACELESLALRLPGRVSVSVGVQCGGWVDGALVRVGAAYGTDAGSLAAATRRALPSGADLMVPHWRQAPRYAATLPLGRLP